jgi:hypothetical protein
VIERPKTILVLAEADRSSKVSVEELTAAAEAFASLQGALREWADQMRSGAAK